MSHCAERPPLTRRGGLTPRARRNRLENELILRLGRIATDLHRLAKRSDESLAASDTARLRLVLDDALAAIRRIV